MVTKLRINESINLMDTDVYNSIVLLGLACTLASNDLHHIHLCATGDKFQQIHEDAESYMNRVNELNDFCLELAQENNISIPNETFALQLLSDNGVDWNIDEKESYDFESAYKSMSTIFTDLCQFISNIQDMKGVTSDVSSELDSYRREFSKVVNYFISKKLYI